MSKKGFPEAIVRAVMSLYHGEEMKVGLKSELFKGILMLVGVQFIKNLCCYH